MIFKAKKLNIKSGFSLMEMLVVMLIASVIAAATAPMINKKVITNTTSDSPWLWTGLNQSLAFNMDGKQKTVNIGGINQTDNPRLYVESIANEASASSDCPQIKLAYNTNTGALMTYIMSKATGIAIGNIATALGNKSICEDQSVVIGLYTQSMADKSVAIGYGTRIGSNGLGTALGYLASATGKNSIAIGNSAAASGENSIAIGSQIAVSQEGSIVLGSPSSVGSKSVALGNETIATGEGSSAVGYKAQASDGHSTAVGSTTISGIASTVFGKGAAAAGTYSTAVGAGANSQNFVQATSVGFSAYSLGNDSTAVGYGAGAGEKSTAVGVGAVSIGTDNVVLGNNVTSQKSSKLVIVGDTNVRADETFNSSVVIGSSEYPGAARKVKEVVAIGKDVLFLNDGGIAIGDTAAVGLSPSANNAIAIGGTLNLVPNTNSVGIGGFSSGNNTIHLVNTTTTVPGSFYAASVSSDKRLKNIGKPFTGGIAEIRKLVPYNFTFKKDKTNTPHVGLIAQDLQKVFPNAVSRGDDGFLYIRLEDVFYSAINAIKELSSRVDILDNMIAKKQSKIDELEKRKNDLEKRIAKLEGNI